MRLSLEAHAISLVESMTPARHRWEVVLIKVSLDLSHILLPGWSGEVGRDGEEPESGWDAALSCLNLHVEAKIRGRLMTKHKNMKSDSEINYVYNSNIIKTLSLDPLLTSCSLQKTDTG